jgi:hypothetical protein
MQGGDDGQAGSPKAQTPDRVLRRARTADKAASSFGPSFAADGPFLTAPPAVLPPVLRLRFADEVAHELRSIGGGLVGLVQRILVEDGL